MGTTRSALCGLAACGIGMASATAGEPELLDWTEFTFGPSSSEVDHLYFPLDPGTTLVYEGAVENGAIERIEREVLFQTRTILGVENRVIRDSAYVGGRLVEVALDYYAQSTDGTVWYFGEFVVNYRYDDEGNPTVTDNLGSWIADDVTNFPGTIMLADPEVGDHYYQEFAPGVAFDFALINGLDEHVDIPFGVFDEVMSTSEGNLFDGPELAENKLFAHDLGLVLIQTLDDEGEVEFSIPIVARYCPADFDRSGFVDGEDFDDFVEEFEAGRVGADFNQDGFATGDDYDLFVEEFVNGC